MSRYTILDAPTTDELEMQVNSMIEAGFEPVGGVFVDRYVWENERKGETHIEEVFFQAVYRRESAQ